MTKHFAYYEFWDGSRRQSNQRAQNLLHTDCRRFKGPKPLRLHKRSGVETAKTPGQLGYHQLARTSRSRKQIRYESVSIMSGKLAQRNFRRFVLHEGRGSRILHGCPQQK